MSLKVKTRIWALVLAIVAGACAWIPLFNVLAYEFAAITALICSFAFAHLGSVFAQAWLKDSPVSLWCRAVASNLLLLVPPLLILLLNAARVQNCNVPVGLGLYGLLPGVSAICATTVGVVSARLCRRGATAISIGIVTLFLVGGLVRLYFQPALFAYNPFIGFFPGPLYDEDVGIRQPLLWYRAMNLLGVAAAIAAAGRARIVSVAASLLMIGIWSKGGSLGFRTTYQELHQALPGRLENAQLVMRYDPARLDQSAAETLFRDHKWRFHQVTRDLGATPSKRVISYVFPSAKAKRALIGAGGTSVAKPWRGEIYLNQESIPHGTLRHELAHVIAGAARGGWFAAPLTNLGLVEGLATALEDPVDEALDLHQQARILRDLDRAPKLASIFGVGLFAEAPARSYTMAGSFVKFVLQKRGSAFLRHAYREGTISDSGALEADWQHFLTTVEIPKDAQARLADQFLRPSIFGRTCAHEIAELKQSVATARGAERVALWRKIVGFDGNPNHVLELGRAQADIGDRAGAIVSVEKVLAHPAASEALHAAGNEFLGDLAWRQDDLVAARRVYERAQDHAQSEVTRRSVNLKLRALEDPAVGPLYRQFLLQHVRRDPVADALLLRDLQLLRPGDGVPHYLLGRQLYFRDLLFEAKKELALALQLGLSDHHFEQECSRLLALVGWRARDFTLAQQAATQWGTRDASDLLERIQWERSR